MSHSHEPSYYEIALTNRQVLTVFVVLLVCIVVAFFSGVWVGRREFVPARPAEIASPADSGLQEPTEEVATVGELNFFSEPRVPADPSPESQEAAAAARSDSTLLEDLQGTRPSAAAEVERPADRLAQRPSPAESAPAKPGSTSAAPVGEHVIQVFSSADHDQAKRLQARLESGGYPAFLSPVDVDGQTMYRVRVGPYLELAEAEAVADRVRRTFRLDTWVTR